MHKRPIIVCLLDLAVLFSVEAVSMFIIPSTMVLGSANTVLRLEMRCSSDGSSNNGIYSLQISRRRFTETGFSSLVVLNVLDGIKKDPNIPADILAKSPNITGGLVGTPPTSGTLTFTMNGGSITCNDQAEFECEMTYKITRITGSLTVRESNNFSVIIGGVSMLITPSAMVVGSASYVTRLELRCSSDGTSNNGIYSLEISRRRFTEPMYTSLVVLDVLDGIKQDPNIPADILAKSPNVTGGLVGSPPTSGTLTLTMNGGSITCNDQAEFKCEMTYKITGITGSRTVFESNTFTVIISSSSGVTSVNTGGQEGSSGNSSTALAAVLGVVVAVSVILIVILSLFLHRSHKLTKELQSQLQSRSHTYDGLMGTDVNSEPYAILNLRPADNNIQSNYLNPYDRLNRSVVSSEP